MSENRLDFLTLSTDAKNYQERLTHDEFHRIVAQRSAKQKMKTIHLRYTQIGSVKTVCQIFNFFQTRETLLSDGKRFAVNQL